ALPAYHRRSDSRSDVVVARRDVRGEGTQGVERRLAAGGELLVHVLLDLVHRHVAGAFDHHLAVALPGGTGELAQGLELRELSSIVRVRNGTGAQPIAQREADVVRAADLADLLEVLVEEALAV